MINQGAASNETKLTEVVVGQEAAPAARSNNVAQAGNGDEDAAGCCHSRDLAQAGPNGEQDDGNQVGEQGQAEKSQRRIVVSVSRRWWSRNKKSERSGRGALESNVDCQLSSPPKKRITKKKSNKLTRSPGC